MPYVRTFIAVGLPAEVRETLKRYQQQLGAPRPAYVKWVNPEGIHLTLKFLGNVEEARLPHLAEALTDSIAGMGTFMLQTGAPGAFPNPRNPRVLWVGLEGGLAALLDLQQSVEEALARLGFPRESRPFTAHLTLGRVRETATLAEKQQLGRALAGVRAEVPLNITVNEIHIMKSELSPRGATYTSLYRISLGR